MAQLQVAPVVVPTSAFLRLLSELGIDPDGVRDVHFDRSRVTVTRVIRLPEGCIPMGRESRFKIETYPMVSSSEPLIDSSTFDEPNRVSPRV
jgi:hypothetical protein